METMFKKKSLAVSLAVAFFGMLGTSSLVLADEGNSMAEAEPAATEEAAADAAAAPADDAAPAEEAEAEEEAEPAAE